MTHQRRYAAVETALRAMRDSMIIAIGLNPALRVPTKQAFDERLVEAFDALNLPEDPNPADMLAALKIASDALAGTLKARGYVPGLSTDGWAPEVQTELRSLVAIRAAIAKAEG